MSMAKKYTKQDKIKILEESKKIGVKATLEKHALYPATFYYWKKKYDELGEKGMDHGYSKEKDSKIRELEKENKALKELLGEKELEGKLKDELLKKKYPHLKNVL